MRFDQCTETCTTDCGHCKGQPVAALRADNERLARRLAGRFEETDKLRAEVASLTAELERQRPVVEAARAWRAAVLEVDEADDLDNEISLLDELDGAISAQRRLAAAVDALDGAPGEATP